MSEQLRIMICDDSILTRRQMKNNLTDSFSCEIVEAANGAIALEEYKKQKPDLIFLDIVMPVKDGLTTAKEILEYDPEACIVIASSVCTQKNLQEAFQAGVKDFIQKPVTQQDLQRVVPAVLERRK